MKKVILLVEDEPNDIYFMQRAMKQSGVTHELHVVEDGQQAIDYLGGTGEFTDRKKYPLPTIMLLDLKLPHVMGLDVLRWLRHQPQLHTIIVIVFTSSQLRPDIQSAYKLGANSYIAKPSTPEALLKIFNQINEYWLELNQPPEIDASI